MKYDVIIIGAGLGGLTAGAKLAKEGKKVLLVEQHSMPGGCATTFNRCDYRFEVGLHEMDGLHDKDMKAEIFEDLGVFDHVQFVKVPEFYRFVYKDYDIAIPHDPSEAKEVLLKFFPGEESGIDAYFHQVLNARKIMENQNGEEERTIGDFLDSITPNNDLKLALLGNIGYYHDDPYSLSLNYYSIAQGSYYSGGGHFIKGGSQQLSNYLAKLIVDNGGEIVYDHLVTRIIVENDVAAGIACQKKNSDEAFSAYGRKIISNSAIPYVAKRLLPPNYKSLMQKDIAKRTLGVSLLSIYLGFNRPVKSLGNKCYSSFVFDDSIDDISDIFYNNKTYFKNRSFTFVDYSLIDSGLAPAGKSVGVICCIDYSADWEELDRDEYDDQKEKVAQIFIDKLEKLIPGIKEAIDHYEVSTSKTIERYTLNPGGSVYGFAQTPERFNMDPVHSVNNLYFASAWTGFGGGFSGVINNGYLSAVDILRETGR